MRRVESIYALLVAADPVTETGTLDTAPLVARVESELGWASAGPPSTMPAPKETIMTTHQTAQPGTLVSVPSGHSWQGPLIALGTAAVVLVIAGVGALGFWLGSESTTVDTAAVPAATLQTIDDWGAAFLTEPVWDYPAFEAMYGETGVFEDPHGTFTGSDSIVFHLQSGDPSVTFSEMNRTSVVAGEGVVVVEWDTSGMSSPSVGAEMEPFETQIVTVFEIDADGMIERSINYFSEQDLYNR